MWTRRAAGPRGAAGGGWGEGFPRMERAGRCAQPGKMGRAESWGARSYPGPSLLGARRGSLGTIGFVPRRWRALCPRKTKGATGVRVGNSELCSGSWILSLAGKESGPWRYCLSCLADLLASSGETLGWEGAEARPRGGALFLRGALPPSQGWLFLSQMWLQRGLG